MKFYVLVFANNSKSQQARKSFPAKDFANGILNKTDALNRCFSNQGQGVEMHYNDIKKRLINALKLTHKGRDTTQTNFLDRDSTYILCYEIPSENLSTSEIASYYYENDKTIHNHLKYVIDINGNKKSARKLLEDSEEEQESSASVAHPVKLSSMHKLAEAQRTEDFFKFARKQNKRKDDAYVDENAGISDDHRAIDSDLFSPPINQHKSTKSITAKKQVRFGPTSS